ncbi:penicillin-binding protein activator LpoB [bacterium]|nr:penicillin-binding protein activator LpoB [candidate division CSSED10-310 bacterium]
MRNGIFMSVMAVCVLILTACQTVPVVQRVEPTETIDLSGRWNDTDSRLVAEEMISDSLDRPWLMAFVERNGRKPAVIVGTIINRTHELISTDTFIRDMERAFINDGSVRVVQSAEAREDLRNERADQQQFADPETAKRWRRELGADFMLQGVINSIVDSYEDQKVVYYQVDLELTDIETNEKVWLGTKKIKKYISRY